MNRPMDEEWCVLAKLLPSGWEGLAKETGAMQRQRGQISDPEVLLRLLLMHIASGLSLKQTVARAQAQELVTMTDVALFKRLRTSEGWLRELARRMYDSSGFSRPSFPRLGGRRLRAVDATTIQEPGSKKASWRVHYSIVLPSLSCDYFEVSPGEGQGSGETYKRIPIEPGDIVLADRGYCHRSGVADVLRRQGDVVVRLNSTSFPLLHPDREEPFGLLPHLRSLSACRPRDWRVRFEADGESWSGRLCCVRKSKQAAELAKKRVKRLKSKNGTKLRPDTLEFAEFVFVLTTIDDSFKAKEILELYRARWQIELCFKRMKSLLNVAGLPKTTDPSSRAWIQGKLLTVMMIERLIEQAKFFSPWGFDLHSP